MYVYFFTFVSCYDGTEITARATVKCTLDCHVLMVHRVAVSFVAVGGTPVFGRWTDPVLRSACSWQVTTMWVNCPLQVSQLGRLSLSSFRAR